MSGRPSDPSYTPLVWDSNNYAAGGDPWAGTPKRVDPTYRFWTPKLKAAAQFLNFVFGSILDVQGTAKQNAVATLDLVGQQPALNWLPKTTSSATKNTNRAAWSTKDQAWFAVGAGSDCGVVSYDFGRTWGDLTLGSTLSCLDVAADASGNVSIINAAIRTVYYGTRAGYRNITFAATANALTVAPSGGTVTFEATAAKFIACYRNGALGQKVDTSSNGTTWAPQTIPTAWTSYTGGNSPSVGAANGIAIAAFYDENASLMRLMRSTDGGTTWTALSNPTISLVPLFWSKPTWDAVNNVWWMTMSTNSGARKTSVLKSTDSGVTWTEATYLAANDFVSNGMAALGALLVLANDDGRIAVSYNASTSWAWVAGNPQTTQGTPSTPLGLATGGGGLLLLNAADRVAYASVRFGNDGQAV